MFAVRAVRASLTPVRSAAPLTARATLSTSLPRLSPTATEQSYNNILVSDPKEGVRLVTLNRPKAVSYTHLRAHET